MILCSCRFISDADIKNAIDTLLEKSSKISSESVAQILEKPYIEEKGHCLTCIPNIKQEIRNILQLHPIIQKYEAAA